MAYIPRLKEEYKNRVISALKEEFGYTNVMQVPKLEKIVLSKGVGAAVSDKKLIDYAVDELTKITGQKAVSTISKKDVASFKLRKGMPIGAKVTLRGERMYEFLDRLVTSSLPRVRDFSGIKATGFDGRGNYNLGVTEQIIFPEIDIDKVNKISGLDITFVTSALPRVRDFNGIKATGFDGRGNYNLGVLEQIIFPEIDIDKVNKISGMDITFVTSAATDKEAKSLLAELGLPFKKN